MLHLSLKTPYTKRRHLVDINLYTIPTPLSPAHERCIIAVATSPDPNIMGGNSREGSSLPSSCQSMQQLLNLKNRWEGQTFESAEEGKEGIR